MTTPADWRQRNAAIYRRHREGATTDELAAEYGLSASRIRQIVAQRGRVQTAAEIRASARRQAAR